ncbi:DUF4267 domain-containing protein [Streptomonospora nanhaiensis]|uniref:Small membrane hydrophobic protein n=1 Tax=Streptomonospora nanhaiensis TaxID=1323731 RepID=A0A853BPZ8_9ACTN|nr:DUF4267 domain-containing protein [Streptomonospora nanhaiensis]MBV2365114.1 DUF4267 domain-containing protein [Streptomonospora nanhaiensis]MBX9391914.1 DUF4267 domain-containing protein [Streptomonospora nanhaiensis]NYI96677.1 hypothetical protein [Streptomonospora nanhaiensis]
MVTTVATALAGLIGAAVVFMGVHAFFAPHAAAGFGIPGTPTEDPAFRSWLNVKSARDIASGLIILLVLAAGTPQLLGWLVLIATGIPVADGLIVLRAKGPKATAYGVHLATAAVMLVVSVLLLLG